MSIPYLFFLVFWNVAKKNASGSQKKNMICLGLFSEINARSSSWSSPKPFNNAKLTWTRTSRKPHRPWVSKNWPTTRTSSRNRATFRDWSCSFRDRSDLFDIFWILSFLTFWWFLGIFSHAGRSSTVHTVHTSYFGTGGGTPPNLSCQLFSCRIQGQNFMTCAWTWYWTALGGQKQIHIKADA